MPRLLANKIGSLHHNFWQNPKPIDQWSYFKHEVKDHEIIGMELEWYRKDIVGRGIIYDWDINAKSSSFTFSKVALKGDNGWMPLDPLDEEAFNLFSILDFYTQAFQLKVWKNIISAVRNIEDIFILYTDGSQLPVDVWNRRPQ